MVLQFLDHCHRKILLNVFCAGIFTSKLYKPLPIGGFINLFRIPALKAVCAVDGVDGRGQCCSMESPRLTSHLNFEYFLCLMSLEYHLAHHWQNIWYSHNVINIFAVKLEIIFLRWCGKARKVSELISKPNLCTWSFLLLEIWFNPGTSNVRLFVSDEDQEPSQPANLNLAVLLFSAIIYHCGRHQAPGTRPAPACLSEWWSRKKLTCREIFTPCISVRTFLSTFFSQESFIFPSRPVLTSVQTWQITHLSIQQSSSHYAQRKH